MFLYPALITGFFFVAVPLLVHLINMLRHRRQRWAAMDFLLSSYRKQKKWIVLRQLLLLLSRLALAALLILLLAGWTGGRQLLGILGGKTTHHVVLLDDSYSMGDVSSGSSSYQQALQTISDLTQRLAGEEGEHQLTILRASRAALSIQGGKSLGDSAADISAQTVTGETRLINRIMATQASPMRTDMLPAIELASKLIQATPADEQFLYLASDFRQRDWESSERIAELLRGVGPSTQVQLIDCAASPIGNLAITDLSPRPDVWVAGVPVVISVSVKNHGASRVENVMLSVRLVLYGDQVTAADPGQTQSGKVDAMPAIVIQSIEPDQTVTKTFQVFVPDPGTHAVEVRLADDALAADNRRVTTLPLSDSERVLVIDDDPDLRGAYHVASVLNPGSQVRTGAIPDIQPTSFLRDATDESLAAYRAIYLIDLPRIGETAAAALDRYVRAGGGLAWFLGRKVQKTAYNQTLIGPDRSLLPARLDDVRELATTDSNRPSVTLGDETGLMAPIRGAGESLFALVGIGKSWELESWDAAANQPVQNDGDQADSAARPRVEVPLRRRDGLPLVMQHDYGSGRIITVTTGLDGTWTNWPGDPTFVVFMLQANAMLWSAASPVTARLVDQPISQPVPEDQYSQSLTWLPAANEPPRLPIEITASKQLTLDPADVLIQGDVDLDDLLKPGIGELVLTELDGRNRIVPIATNVRIGESDLTRAGRAEVLRSLGPIDAKFIDAGTWSVRAGQAGNSAVSILLLGLLAAMLAIEQSLAYWASYHVAGSRT